ncbi:MAG TPA: hypothetical protein VFE51_29770 [Verrucomicrobiae bacterium]|nr:hypothetical protein [Verrucomicrobiae bacterium]
MKRFIPVFLATLTLIIGLAGGWFTAAHCYNPSIGSYMETSKYNNLSQRCRVLTELRAGQTNEAVATLETLMDGDILVFGSFVRDMPANGHRPADIKLLATVRKYRAAHPWKAAGYPDIDQGVADVFALVSTNRSQ